MTLDQDATITALVEIHPRLVVHVGFTRDSAGAGTIAADRQSDPYYVYWFEVPSRSGPSTSWNWGKASR